MKKVIISARTSQKRIAILEANKLLDVMIDQPSQEEEVGDIYYGKVDKVLPGIEAAFVDMGLLKQGFLQREQLLSFKQQANKNLSISRLVHQGEKKLVQVKKEGIGTKGPRLTDMIELSGKYIVYLPEGNYIAVSKKIEDEGIREQWKVFGTDILEASEGIIFRTACEEVDQEQVKQELFYLRKQWTKLLRKKSESKPGTLVFENTNLYDRIIRDVTLTEIEEIFVDDREAYKQVQERLDLYNHSNIQLELYNEKEEIFSYFGIESEIEKSLKANVWLRKGASIQIEHTEALTVIDVNSTKFTGRSNIEDTILKVNEEAAREIAKQLRLRNIGGMILIDFINMKSREAQEKVLRTLKHAFKKDRQLTRISGFTNLGLLEMTRKKQRGSLQEMLLQDCPSCHGTGSIVSNENIAFHVERALWEYKGMDQEAIWIDVREGVKSFLEEANFLSHLETILHFKVYITETPRQPRFVIRHIGEISEIKERIEREINISH